MSSQQKNSQQQEIVSGSLLTSFKLGGDVQLAKINSLNQLRSFAFDEKFKIIGNGSNLLIPDRGMSELVIKLGEAFSFIYDVSHLESFDEIVEVQELSDLEILLNSNPSPLQIVFHGGVLQNLTSFCLGKKFKIIVGASTPLMRLSSKLTQLGLSGMEFAAGIPASIGGAVCMNAGAHGEQISSILNGVLIFDEDRRIKFLGKENLKFSYRNSGIRSEQIVLAGVFELEYLTAEETQKKRKHNLDYRRLTQPLTYPSAGSTFRNPHNPKSAEVIAAGKLLEQAGFKGYSHGGVEFSKLHANWIIKTQDYASSQNVVELIEIAKEKIYSEFNIELKPELIIW